MGETTGAIHRAALARAGLPVFATPDQAVQGFEHLVRDRRNREAARELPPSRVLTSRRNETGCAACFDRTRAAGRLALTQDESLDVSVRLRHPDGADPRSPPAAVDAADAADLLGYPAVVKLRDRSRSRRTARPAAWCSTCTTQHRSPPPPGCCPRARGARGSSGELLVQRQVGRAREAAIRVADDATFGPMITFGGGGTVPDPSDRAVDLPPLNLALAKALIQRCRTGATARRSRCATARRGAAMRWPDAGAGQPVDRRFPRNRRAGNAVAVRRSRRRAGRRCLAAAARPG